MRKSIALPIVLLALAGLALGLRATSPLNLEEAIEVQRQLVLDQSSDPNSHNDLGNLLALAGRTEEAQDAYGQAISLDPSLASAHYNLGLLLSQNDQASKALDSFKKAVAAEPDYAWAWFQLGWLHEQKNQRRKAVNAYSQALSLDPNLGIAQVNPQILDSDWVTEAMMKAYKTPPQTANAPKSYSDSERIREVMMGSVQQPGKLAGSQRDPETAMDPSTSTAAATSERRPIARNPVAFDNEGEEIDPLDPSEVESAPVAQQPAPTRVIGPQDLDSKGRINQASPAPNVQGFSVPSGGSQVRTWTPPSRRTPPRNEEAEGRDDRSYSRPQIPQPSQATPESGRVRYRPGVSSSGRSSSGIGRNNR